MADDRKWTLTDHVCRLCFGRVLETVEADRTHRARCSNCGTEVRGTHIKLCACGTKLRDGRDAGLRCVENPTRGPADLSEIIAVCAGDDILDEQRARHRAAASRKPRPAFVSDDDIFGGLTDE
jgi:hypothetical protein